MRNRHMGGSTGMSSRGGTGMSRQSGGVHHSRTQGGGDSYSSSYRFSERPPGIGQKLSTSCSSLIFGILLIILGCLLLWNNEGCSIMTHRSLNEALDAHRPITDASAVPDGAYDHELVHLTHKLEVEAPASDQEFGLVRPGAIALTRTVEIYQWVEKHKKTKRKLPNGETEARDAYSYDAKWVTSPVNSDRFVHRNGHENYGTLPFRGETFRSGAVRIGAYLLDGVFVSQLKARRPVPAEEVKKLPGGASIQNGYVYLSIDGVEGSGATPALPSSDENADWSRNIDKQIVTVDGQDRIMYTVKSTGELFTSQEQAIEAAKKAPVAASQVRNNRHGHGAVSASGPQISDVRVGFTEIVQLEPVSVLGKQVGERIVSWPSKQGSGYDIALLRSGVYSAREMVEGAQSSNNIFTWVKRGGGWLLNMIGFFMVTQIISTAADITLNWIPLLGPMTMSIINLGLSIANFVLASSLSFLVAAIAWIRYRPTLGVTMLVGSLGLFYLASQAGGKAKGKRL